MFQVNEIGNDLDREIELLTAVHRQVLTEAGQEDIADLLDRLQSAESEVELPEFPLPLATRLAAALTMHLHLVNLADERHRVRMLNLPGQVAGTDAGDDLWPAVSATGTPLRDALEHLDETLETTPVQDTLTEFVDDFPAKPVYKGEVTVPQFLASDTAGDPNSQVALEEMLLLWLSNTNPAFEPYRELFDDTPLERDTAYEQMIQEMRQFFAGQPGFGEGNVSLIDMLEAPAKASPYSLEGQLEFIRQKWPAYLGKNVFRLLAGLDLIAEEEKPVTNGIRTRRPPSASTSGRPTTSSGA